MSILTDPETDQLMREWNGHLQEVKQKPCMLVTINDRGEISVLSVNEFTRAHIIDACERLIEVYKEKK